MGRRAAHGKQQTARWSRRLKLFVETSRLEERIHGAMHNGSLKVQSWLKIIIEIACRIAGKASQSHF